MSVTRVDLNREQAAHAETRAALAAAKAEIVRLRDDLAGRPATRDLDSARAAAKGAGEKVAQLAAELADRPTQRDMDSVRAELASLRAELADRPTQRDLDNARGAAKAAQDQVARMAAEARAQDAPQRDTVRALHAELQALRSAMATANARLAAYGAATVKVPE